MGEQCLNKRHGLVLQCKTCHVRNNFGGYEDPRQFARIVQEKQREHFNHDYALKQSYHAAELQHAFAEQTTRQTRVNSSSYATISGATISNSSLTNGKKYLLFATAVCDTSDTSTLLLKFRVATSAPAAFDDSEHIALEVSSSGNRSQYMWWTVWTANGTDSINVQFACTAGIHTVGADQVTLTAIKLSDDLTENTDWGYNDVTASTSLATTDSTTNNATLTVTPPAASTPMLVLTRARSTASSTTRSIATRIVRSGEASSTTPFCQLEPRNSTNPDAYVNILARVFSCGNASNTFTEKSFSTTASAHTRTNSAVFYLNLNKLNNNSYSYDDSSVTDLAATSSFVTQIATTSVTPTVTGDVWCLAWTTFDANSQNQGWKCRMQIDNTDQPGTQTSDAYNISASHDTTDELVFTIQSVENLSNAAHTIDMDGSVSAATAGRGCRAKLVMGVTMELPSAGGLASKFVQNESLGLTEDRLFKADRKTLASETATVTEGKVFVGARMMRISETLTLAEQIITNAVRYFQASELANLTENYQHLRGRRFTVDELATLTEQLSTKADRKVTMPETLNLLEATITKSDRRFLAAAELLNLTEQRLTKADRKFIQSEILNLIEQSPITKADRIMQAGEQLNLLEGFLNNIRGRIMIVNEPITILEAHIFARQAMFRVNEIMTMTEQFNSVANRSMVISELANIAEQPSIMVGAKKMVVQEAMTLAEQLITAAQRIMPVSEAMSISEFVSDFIAGRKFVSTENLGLTENILTILSTEGVARKFVSEENISLSEATPIFRKGLSMLINENLSVLESLIALGQRQMQINENAIITESLETVRQVKMLIAEAMEVSDAFPVFVRVVNMVVSEILNMSESFISNRGKLFVVNEALEILESIVVKLEENVGPPPGAYWPVFFGIPTAQRRRVQLPKYKAVEKRELIRELPKPRIIVTRDYEFIYNIEMPAPTAQALLQQLQMDALRDKYANVLPPIPTTFPQRRHMVSRDYSFSYNIMQLVEQDITFSYNVHNTIERDYAFSYDLNAVNWNMLASIREKKYELDAVDSIDSMEQEMIPA